MNVNPSAPIHWSYLPLRQATDIAPALPLLAEEDAYGPARFVLCAAQNRRVLEPYLQQLRSWQTDPLTHPQPVIPVTTDSNGLAWFSPEGALHDFPELDSRDSSSSGCHDESTRIG